MVIGLGIDVVSVSRVERALRRFGDRFWDRILTPGERADLRDRVDRATALAGRFAAKEAATKALGGPPDVFWQDIEVRKTSRGPMVTFKEAGLAHAERLRVTHALVSITHDAGVAAAVVVLEGTDTERREV
jgi:holo-[acyl-carrier protein] synthase